MLLFPIKTPISLEPTKNLSVKPCSAHFCSMYDLINAIAGARAQLQTPALAREACLARVELGGGFGKVFGTLWVPTTSHCDSQPQKTLHIPAHMGNTRSGRRRAGHD